MGIYNQYTNSTLLVVQAKQCKPSAKCLAAYLAAVQPYTYLHCMGNGDDVIGKTYFKEMDYDLGAPDGDAQETKPGSQIWKRSFASGTNVTWNNKKKTGSNRARRMREAEYTPGSCRRQPRSCKSCAGSH